MTRPEYNGSELLRKTRIGGRARQIPARPPTLYRDACHSCPRFGNGNARRVTDVVRGVVSVSAAALSLESMLVTLGLWCKVFLSRIQKRSAPSPRLFSKATEMVRHILKSVS
ncbi:hypothetical protein E2C01_049101 [Portunus trituberculatus]|uniref:Uncharacterized protein n=1 Tax=Portunus trituberculatus TaxID=210409 RepID=A0A5B7G5B6_PORTR|nr:hypothetical protein [Portunus trituberculatus]